MKTKLRRLVSILSAMVLMVCCSVPAFADDTVTKNDLSSVKWNIVSKSSDIPHFTDVYNRFQSTISKTDNYIAVYGKKSDGTSETNILYFDPTAIAYYSFTNNQFLFGSNFDYDSQRLLFKFDSSDKNIEQVGYGGWSVTKPSGFQKPECRALINLNDYVQTSVKVYFHTKIYDFDNLENELEPPDPNAAPIPFTVDYSPSLKTGLVRKGTLVAPGASNDGQVVETNTIAVTVKITDAFLNASKPISGAYTYSYQFTCFVVPSEYKDSDIKTMSEHAIYTAAQDNLHYLYYENETLDVDDSLSSEPATGPDMIPVSEQWANATGVSNCFLLERDSNNSPLRNVTIDLHNIDFEKHKSDS